MTAATRTVDATAATAAPATADDNQLRRLRSMQWTLRGALGLALAVSMAANVLHAAPDPVARSIAAWSPLALYTAIEVMTRVPIRNRLLGGIRIVATVAIAAIAGITSYLHMVGVVERYGESWQVVYLLPVSVDGLVAVLTLSLLDIASQVRTINIAPPPQVHPTGPDLGTAAAPADHEAAATDAAGDAGAAEPAAAARSLKETARTRQPRPRRPTGRTTTADSQQDTPGEPREISVTLPDDLQALLEPASRVYREMQESSTPVTRDAFAAALREKGQPLRSAKVALLLTAIRHPHE